MELLIRPLLKKRHKKSFTDFVGLFFFITVLFGVAMFVVILYNTYNDHMKDRLASSLEQATPDDSDVNVTRILGQTSGGISKLNPLFPLLVVGVIGYIVMLVFLSRSHPALFFIGILVLGVALIIAATFSNVFEAIGETSNFNGTVGEMGIISIFMNNLPILVFILFVGIAILLYAMKTGPPQGGAY